MLIEKSLSLMQSYVLFLLLLPIIFNLISMKSLSRSKSWSIAYVYSSNTFTVRICTRKSLVHFELIYVSCVRKGRCLGVFLFILPILCSESLYTWMTLSFSSSEQFSAYFIEYIFYTFSFYLFSFFCTHRYKGKTIWSFGGVPEVLHVLFIVPWYFFFVFG